MGKVRKIKAKTYGKDNIQNQRAEKEDFKLTSKILNAEFSA